MPIDLQALRAVTREIAVDICGETLRVTYRPAAITEAAVRGLGQADAPFQLLVDAIASWDLMDGEAMVPITVESLKELPVELATAAIDAILDEARRRPTRKAGH